MKIHCIEYFWSLLWNWFTEKIVKNSVYYAFSGFCRNKIAYLFCEILAGYARWAGLFCKLILNQTISQIGTSPGMVFQITVNIVQSVASKKQCSSFSRLFIVKFDRIKIHIRQWELKYLLVRTLIKWGTMIAEIWVAIIFGCFLFVSYILNSELLSFKIRMIQGAWIQLDSVQWIWIRDLFSSKICIWSNFLVVF